LRGFDIEQLISDSNTEISIRSDQDQAVNRRVVSFPEFSVMNQYLSDFPLSTSATDHDALRGTSRSDSFTANPREKEVFSLIGGEAGRHAVTADVSRVDLREWCESNDVGEADPDHGQEFDYPPIDEIRRSGRLVFLQR
jgi:hypothetical protein